MTLDLFLRAGHVVYATGTWTSGTGAAGYTSMLTFSGSPPAGDGGGGIPVRTVFRCSVNDTGYPTTDWWCTWWCCCRSYWCWCWWSRLCSRCWKSSADDEVDLSAYGLACATVLLFGSISTTWWWWWCTVLIRRGTYMMILQTTAATRARIIQSFVIACTGC